MTVCILNCYINMILYYRSIGLKSWGFSFVCGFRQLLNRQKADPTIQRENKKEKRKEK